MCIDLGFFDGLLPNLVRQTRKKNLVISRKNVFPITGPSIEDNATFTALANNVLLWVTLMRYTGWYFSNRKTSFLSPSEILTQRILLLQTGHMCTFPGCKNVLVLDGNQKNQKSICMPKDAGYIEFLSIPGSIKSGCINTPQYNSRFCEVQHAILSLFILMKATWRQEISVAHTYIVPVQANLLYNFCWKRKQLGMTPTTR